VEGGEEGVKSFLDNSFITSYIMTVLYHTPCGKTSRKAQPKKGEKSNDPDSTYEYFEEA